MLQKMVSPRSYATLRDIRIFIYTRTPHLICFSLAQLRVSPFLCYSHPKALTVELRMVRQVAELRAQLAEVRALEAARGGPGAAEAASARAAALELALERERVRGATEVASVRAAFEARIAALEEALQATSPRIRSPAVFREPTSESRDAIILSSTPWHGLPQSMQTSMHCEITPPPSYRE